MVFVTWTEWILTATTISTAWINSETHLIEYCENTVRASYLAGGQSLYGSNRYGNFREVEGMPMPHELSFYFKTPNDAPQLVTAGIVAIADGRSARIDEVLD